MISIFPCHGKGFCDGKASYSQVISSWERSYVIFPFPTTFHRRHSTSRTILAFSSAIRERIVGVAKFGRDIFASQVNPLFDSSQKKRRQCPRDFPTVARFLHKDGLMPCDSRDSYNPLEYKCIVSAARLKLLEFAGVARQTRLRAVCPVNTPRKSNVTPRAPNWDAAAVAVLKTSTSGWRAIPGRPSTLSKLPQANTHAD